jgi:hypothetical protein
MEMDMDRRLIFLPLILLLTALACSQLPGQKPATISAPSPVLGETNTFIDLTKTPEDDNILTHTYTSLPPTVDVTPTPPPQEDLRTFSGQVESSEMATAWYVLQPGSPVATNNIFHPELGCNWLGLGGQIFAESGQSVGMLVVELGGSHNGKEVNGLTLTGSAVQWGPGGYEFQVDNQPSASQGELWLRVMSLAGDPLSDRIYIDTYGDCERSAILVNFIYYSALTYETLYFPVIIQDQK